MTLGELADRVKWLLSTKRVNENTPILISLADPSIGGRASAEVYNVYAGFDWEEGQVRIEPKIELFKNIKRLDNPIGIVREEFGGVSFNACGKCHMRIAKDDKYCRWCGQRLR